MKHPTRFLIVAAVLLGGICHAKDTTNPANDAQAAETTDAPDLGPLMKH